VRSYDYYMFIFLYGVVLFSFKFDKIKN